MPIDHNIYTQTAPPHDALKSLNDQEVIRHNRQANETNTFELQQKQKAARVQQLIGEAMSQGLNADGTVNEENVGRAILSNPDTATAWPKMQLDFATGHAKALDVTKARQEVDRLEAEQMGEIAEKAKFYPPAARADWLLTNVAKLMKAKLIDEEDGLAIITRATPDDPSQPPDPAVIDAILNDMTVMSDEALGKRATTRNTLATAAQTEGENLAIPDKNAELKAKAAQAEMVTAGMSPTGITATDQATLAGQAAQRAETHRSNVADEAIARLRAQEAAAGGGPSGLVEAVIANPELWDQITPTERGKIAPELNRLGFTGFGKPLSDGANKQIAESTSAIDSLKDLRVILQKNEQYIGPLAGLQALNPYSEARKAQADIDLVRQRVGKALEGGVLRKEDEEKYKKILSTLRDVPDTAIYKVDALIKTIENDVKNFKNQQRLSGKRVAPDTPAVQNWVRDKTGKLVKE